MRRAASLSIDHCMITQFSITSHHITNSFNIFVGNYSLWAAFAFIIFHAVPSLKKSQSKLRVLDKVAFPSTSVDVRNVSVPRVIQFRNEFNDSVFSLPIQLSFPKSTQLIALV